MGLTKVLGYVFALSALYGAIQAVDDILDDIIEDLDGA